jgi:glycerol uptake facilitator-like aquaporin
MLIRKAAAEGVGSALLLAAVVGSGIMGERLAGGNAAVALLANSLATGGALLALITALGPVSGAHFNPFVTLALAGRGESSWRDVPAVVFAQVIGAAAGVIVANLMFNVPAIEASTRARSGSGRLLGEAVATFGLLAIVLGCVRRPAAAAPAVAGYITAAYWFTSSTSFANPAVTLARSMTDTFAGIRPADVPGFVAAQAVGAALSFAFFRWIDPVPEAA